MARNRLQLSIILSFLGFIAAGFALLHWSVAIPPSDANTSRGVSRQQLAASFASLPLHFEANQGQAHEQVKFLSRGAGYALFLTSTEVVIALRQPQMPEASSHPNGPQGRNFETPSHESGEERHAAFPSASLRAGARNNLVAPNYRRAPLNGEHVGLSAQPEEEGAVLRLQLAGASPSPAVEGADPLPGVSNYLLGNDPAEWRTGVRTYSKVKYRDVYPGVDLVYYGNPHQLEFDFIVAPGASPENIQLDFSGAEVFGVPSAGGATVTYVYSSPSIPKGAYITSR